MAITDEQYFDGLLEAATTTLKRARELERRFRQWGLMPQELAGVPDEELIGEVRRRGLSVSYDERSTDRPGDATDERSYNEGRQDA